MMPPSLADEAVRAGESALIGILHERSPRPGFEYSPGNSSLAEADEEEIIRENERQRDWEESAEEQKRARATRERVRRHYRINPEARP